ncbi:uncharacterized protein LOC144568678 [Carex rostrata]
MQLVAKDFLVVQESNGWKFVQRHNTALELKIHQFMEDSDEVIEAGGIHAVGTEQHESCQIDNQVYFPNGNVFRHELQQPATASHAPSSSAPPKVIQAPHVTLFCTRNAFTSSQTYLSNCWFLVHSFAGDFEDP